MQCFVHFHLKMCFSPQRHAIFQHLNFKKWSEHAVFCTFWLGNVLLATTACNFSTSQLQKVVRSWCVCTFSLQNVLLTTAACYFWFLLWPHDSAPAALTSLLFDSPDTQIIGKTQRFAFSNIWRGWIFFLLTFALLHLLSSDSTSSSDFLSSDFTSSICFSSAFQLSILSEVYYLNFLRWLYACLRKTMRNLSFCPISLRGSCLVRGLAVRSQFAPTPWWPCRWPSTSRASEHSGSWWATSVEVFPRHSKRFQQCRIIQGNPRASCYHLNIIFPNVLYLSLFCIFVRCTLP